MIVGGWEYIWAAYGITWAVMGLYSIQLVRAWRLERRR